jgi:sugar phosphate isomerase/epimerase
MKLSFSTLGCPAYTIDQVIQTALDHGYQGVEIRHIRGEVLLQNLAEFQPAGIGATARKFAQSGVEVICINSSIRFTSPDPAEREKQLALVAVNSEIAAALGAKYIRVFGGPLPPDQDRTETIGRITEGLNQAVALANRRGVVPLLETHDSFSTGKLAAELLAGVSGNIDLIWDILHSYRNGESFADTVRRIGSRIRHVHIKDSANFSPAGFDFRLPGLGKVPIAAAVAALKSIGYQGYLSFEWEKGWHPEIEEPEVALPLYPKYMRSLAKE